MPRRPPDHSQPNSVTMTPRMTRSRRARMVPPTQTTDRNQSQSQPPAPVSCTQLQKVQRVSVLVYPTVNTCIPCNFEPTTHKINNNSRRISHTMANVGYEFYYAYIILSLNRVRPRSAIRLIICTCFLMVFQWGILLPSKLCKHNNVTHIHSKTSVTTA